MRTGITIQHAVSCVCNSRELEKNKTPIFLFPFFQPFLREKGEETEKKRELREEGETATRQRWTETSTSGCIRC